MLRIFGGAVLLGVSRSQEFSSEIVDNLEYPDGPFWTAWAQWYGCAESTKFGSVTRNDIATKKEFCSNPKKEQLSSIRYRECVLKDDFRYPNNINKGSSKKEARYALLEFTSRDFEYTEVFQTDQVTGKKVVREEATNKNFEEAEPTSGFPDKAPNFDWFFSNGNLGVSDADDKSQSCDYVADAGPKSGLRGQCAAYSSNLLCDPRFQLYADRHNQENNLQEGDNGFLTRKDILDRRVLDNQAEIVAAIPEPYLVYQVQEAICPVTCPVPLPWSSWNCHCAQGSESQNTDVDADTSRAPDDRNPDNLPECDCGLTKRRRYQLCNDDDTTDDVTCESMGNTMKDKYPQMCQIDEENPYQGKDWYRSWFRKLYHGDNKDEYDREDKVPEWSETDPDALDSPNWYKMSYWMNSRNQNTPWRSMDVASKVRQIYRNAAGDEAKDENNQDTASDDAVITFLDTLATEKLVGEDGEFTDAQKFSSVVDGQFHRGMSDLEKEFHAVFEQLVVDQWKLTFENIDESVLGKFLRAYPKYNLLKGAEYGCNFREVIGDDATFTDFSEFEIEFQKCVFESYFKNYALHRVGNEGEDKYFPSLVKTSDDVNKHGTFDTDDFPFIQRFANRILNMFKKQCVQSTTSGDFEFNQDAEDIAYFRDAFGLNFNSNCTRVDRIKDVVEGVFYSSNGDFKFDFNTNRFKNNTILDDFPDWTRTESVDEILELFVHIIQNDLHIGLAEFMHSMENLNGEYFDNATWAMPGQMSQWYEAFVYKWDHKREFTNNIIEFIVAPQHQWVDVSIETAITGGRNAGFAKVESGFPEDGDEKFFFKNLYRDDYTDKKWITGDCPAGICGHNIQREYEELGLFNMTAVMRGEQYRIRPDGAEQTIDRERGFGYDITPNSEYNSATNVMGINERPQNWLEYNFNEAVDKLVYNGEDRDGYCGRLAGCKRRVPLTGAGQYENACWDGSPLGQIVNPFAYSYHNNFEQYEGRYELKNDDAILRVYYERESIKQGLTRFLRNRVTSVEVGMQVDECISDTGALEEWGEWGECSSQCGNGVQWRTKECRADGKLILPDNWDMSTYTKLPGFASYWKPANDAEWNGSWDPECQCEPGQWAESRECSSGCEYTPWADWKHEGGDSPRCYPKYSDGTWSRWDWAAQSKPEPNTCVKAGESREGKLYRTREVRCGDPNVCCGLEHEGPCEMPVCSGWKEWGSWSSWSVKCGPVEHKRTRGRTRDCRGMDGKIGTDSSCPCNAKFDIAECSFRDDNVVNEDNQCPNLNTATTLWANRVAAGDHDQNDPGYLEIVQEDIHICPYLRLACQADGENGAKWDKTQMWDADNCDVNELWWSEWSDCSTSCGDGVQKRHRECFDGSDNPDQEALLGKTAGCRHGIVHEIRYCPESANRPASCPHQMWSAWTECSASCGDSGVQSRHRMCTANGVEVGCFGENSENHRAPEGYETYAQWQAETREDRNCRRTACPRLSQWEPMGECSGQCADDRGVQKMVRHCVGGHAEADGCNCAEVDGNVICTGKDQEDNDVADDPPKGLVWYSACNTDKCPTWSDWGAWSGCVEENDNSAIRRTRACTIYNATSGEWEESSDAVGHRYCRDGDHVEAVACYEDVCPAQ